MQTFDLSGKDEFKVVITESTEKVIFDNIPTSATIKVSVEIEGRDSDTRIPTMPLMDVLEIQEKFAEFDFGHHGHIYLKDVDDTSDPVQQVEVVSRATFMFAILGEIKIPGNNDSIVIQFKNLQNVKQDSKVYTRPGYTSEKGQFRIKKFNYNHLEDKKQLNTIGYRALVLSKDTFPDQIDFRANSEVVEFDQFTTEVHNQHLFGNVVYKDNVPTVGHHSVLFLDITNIDKVLLRDESIGEDWSFYLINSIQ